MSIALPASTDIYLTGGKSHESEIRLAKYLILNLQEGDHFLDVGAHYGYFTLLASEIVGKQGRVAAFEPSPESFQLLQENVRGRSEIAAFQEAVSDSAGTLDFYQFHNLQSEYNAIDVSQYEQESWFGAHKPEKIQIPATTIDLISRDAGLTPKIVKIDVEGAEDKVLRGGYHFLSGEDRQVVIEYLTKRGDHDSHRIAVAYLRELGYQSYAIESAGSLRRIADVDSYMTSHGLESDNIVFRK